MRDSSMGRAAALESQARAWRPVVGWLWLPSFTMALSPRGRRFILTPPVVWHVYVSVTRPGHVLIIRYSGLLYLPLTTGTKAAGALPVCQTRYGLAETPVETNE